MKNALVPVLALLLASTAPVFATSTPAQAQAAAASSSAASPEQTADVVNKVQAFYTTSQTFKSDFSQKFWVKAYNQKKTSKGRVTLLGGGKLCAEHDVRGGGARGNERR